MRFIQKEILFDLNPLEEKDKELITMPKEGQIVEYYINSDGNATVYLLRNNIKERILLFEGERIPIYLDLNQNDKIGLNVKNEESSNIKIGVMLLIQEF